MRGRRSRPLVLLLVAAVAGSAATALSAEAPKRQLLLRGPGGTTLLVVERPVERAVSVPRADGTRDGFRNEYLIRSGTCRRPGKGVAYHVSTWGGVVNVPFDVLRERTFAIEARKAGALEPILCVEHRGGRDLKFTTQRARIVARARRDGTGALVARRKTDGFWDVRLTLTPLRGGAATRLSPVAADAGGSGGAVAHLRRGTCRVRPSSDEIPLGRTERPLTLELPFREFGNGRWVLEVHSSLAGSRHEVCVQL